MLTVKDILQEQGLFIATHNRGKYEEFKRFFHQYSIVLSSAFDANLNEPDEIYDSFEGNARLKAECGARALTTRPVLGDDSGLCCDALEGFPGLKSARFAQSCGGFAPAMQAIKERINARGEKTWEKNRTARFVCALALVFPRALFKTCVVKREVVGALVWPPRGEGFGYDPFFTVQGSQKTFGEMKAEEKEAVSHRTLALEALLALKPLPTLTPRT